MTTTRFRRSARVVAAGAVLAAVGMGAIGSASATGNTFDSQWADAKWTGSSSGLTYEVSVSPGKDNFNGAITEYLKTKVKATECVSGVLTVATFETNEQARDLKGVEVATKNSGATMVNRSITAPGTFTTTPVAGDCATPTGASTSKSMTATLVLKGQWTNNGTPVTYSGEDCGGTGNCYYVDAKANSPKGSVKFNDKTYSIRSTTAAWLWAGAWDLNA